MLMRTASRGFQLRLAAVREHRSGGMPLSDGSMSRRLHGRPQHQLLPGCSPIPSRYHTIRTPHSCCGLARLSTVTRAQPAAATAAAAAAGPTAASSPAAAAVLAAAAVIASTAGSGLGRLPTTPAAAAVATSPSTTSSHPTPSPSSPSSSSAPLEGTPVPWAVLGPSPSSPGPSSSSSPSSLDLIQQRFRIGSATFRLIAPRDVDAVMDLYLEKGLHDADPYWTRAWPSAIALAATLLQRPELVAGKVVADLGAGLGLAGMAAAMAGAREVVLLDREAAALQCALLSAAATGLEPEPEPHSDAASSWVLNPDRAQGAGADTCPQRRPRRRVEPLPADQLPSYATLQLTPPYTHLMQQQQGQQQGQEPGSHVDRQRQREWEVLMALARGLTGAEVQRSQSAAEAAEDGGQAGGSDVGGAVSVESSSHSDSSGATSSGRSTTSSTSSGSAGVLRAHVFDWTSPPAMDRLLPPRPPPQQQQQQQQAPGPGSGRRQKGGGGLARQRRFDVVLACDVLYEDAAVGPIAGLMPQLLEPDGGRLLLADPPNRTVRNRERFLELLRGGGGGGGGGLRLSVEECSLQQCEVSKLDNEMAGGLAPTAETVPVQFLVFRSSLGNDTVGLKM